jgi:hypothetical protein
MKPVTVNRRPIRSATALIAVIALALVASPYAAAESDPIDAQYGDAVAQVTGSGPSEPVPASGKGQGLQKKIVGGLPFTGLDLISLGAVVLALTSMGLALRRLTADGEY